MRETSAIPEREFQSDARCPLDGVRILDLSRVVAGNMASLTLADFGGAIRKPAPMPIGEDNAEILGEIGLSAADLAAIEAREMKTKAALTS